MRGSMLVALCIICSSGQAVADEPKPPPSPYRFSWAVDLPILLVGTALWAGSSAFVSVAPPPHCGTMTTGPCDANLVNALDRPAIRWDPSLRPWATGFGVIPFTFVVLTFADAGPRNWRGWLTDLVVIGEALAWDGALQDIVRRASRRPRPYLYLPDAAPGEREGAEAVHSFYSGHTAFAFTLATSVAYTFQLRHPKSRWRYVVWPALLAVASVQPVLRVLAGDHFPTDVLVGAVVGSGLGILLPALRRRGVALSASVTPTETTLNAAVRF